MAKIINKNPKRDTIGPTTMRRVLKISGLKSSTVVEPVINKNPMMMIMNPKPIKYKLSLLSVNFLFSSIEYDEY